MNICVRLYDSDNQFVFMLFFLVQKCERNYTCVVLFTEILLPPCLIIHVSPSLATLVPLIIQN